MTEDQTREKIRAVFLSALMVFSVFAGSAAFAGTAAANVESLSVAGNSDPVQSDGTIWVSGTASNTDDITFTLEDEDGDTAMTAESITDTSYTVSIDLSGLTFDGGNNDGLSEGTVTIEAVQDSSDEPASDTFEVDDTEPTISDLSVSTAGNDATVELTTDEELGTEDGDIAVDVDRDGMDYQSLDQSDFTKSDNGDSYTYTADLSGLPDGRYSVTLNTALDGAGNDGAAGESDAANVDTTTDFSDHSPTSSVADDETKMSVNIGEGATDIRVTISNSEEVFSGGTDASGVYYSDGVLTIDPSGSDVGSLPDGSVTVSVSAEVDGTHQFDDWSFTVDTTGPEFSGEQIDPESSVDSSVSSSSTPTFSVDIDDADSDLDFSSVEVTIDHPDGTVTLSDSADGVSFTGETLTVDSTGSDVPEFSDGEVTYTVSAADDKGNDNSEAFTYTIDTTNPEVVSGTIKDAPISNQNNDAGKLVTIEFSEPMDTNNNPAVTILVDGADNVDVTNDGSDAEGWSDDGTVWTGTTDSALNGDDADATIEVTADSNAQDVATNVLSDSANTDTFELDTVSPSVSTTSDFPTEMVEGTVDVTTYFQIDSDAEDVTSETYEYSTDSGSSWTEISDETSFDTSQLDDGDVMLRYSVEDDVSNPASVSDTITLDNDKPSVTTDFTSESILTGTVDLTEHFSAENVDGDLTYKYKHEDDSSFTTLTTDGEQTPSSFDVSNMDGSLTLKVSGSDAQDNSDTAEVQVTVDNLKPTLSDVEGTENGTVSFDVTAESELQGLEVTVNTSDDYSEQSSHRFTLDDFQESESDGTYTYSLTTDHVRDGAYTVELKSATSTDDRSYTGSLESDVQSAFVDHHAPEIVDTQIVEAGDTDSDDNVETTVRVEFSEPVQDFDTVSTSEISIEGESVSAQDVSTSVDGVSNTDQKGYATITFDDTFQTGDSPNLTISAGEYSEQYTLDGDATAGDYSGESADTNAEGDKTVVHTLELNLKEGQNVVSVPAASGSIDLTELDALSEDDEVWMYDDGEWQMYSPNSISDLTTSPNPSNDFTTLEGGQGYIFNMNSSATIDVNVYNQPGSSGEIGSSTPGSEDVSEGWNLLGHWQEGSQSVSDGLSTIGDEDYDAVYEQTENGELSFSVASELEPGEGYWVFVTEDDGDAYAEHAWTTS